MRERMTLIALLVAVVAMGGCGLHGHGDDGAGHGTDGQDTDGHAAHADGTDGHGPQGGTGKVVAGQNRGLLTNTGDASPGFVLFAPILSDTTYLVNNDGLVVHTWKAERAPAASVYLLDNGNILRTAREPDVPTFSGGGQGGRLREITWDGEVVWDYLHASEDYLLHHDVERLPNGNVLAIAWERKTAEEARQAGRRADMTPEAGLWPDMILELEPVKPDGARIVWEWHAWDHLIQNTDPSLPNYGNPAAHPERLDVNGDGEPIDIDPRELEELKALGYVPADTDAEDISSDMMHTNAIAYNAELDQIAISSPRFHEIFVIDHSTTTEEARGSTGGRHGKGGDILYRWGNPRSYGRGDEDDQRLFAQHDVRWIPEGSPGAGNLMVFNNSVPGAPVQVAGVGTNGHGSDGQGTNGHGTNGDGAEPGPPYSAVFEIVPPVDSRGRYTIGNPVAYEPAEPTWRFDLEHAPFISGAHRQPNGHTMVTDGPDGHFIEVDRLGSVVWEYKTPYSGHVRNPDGSFPHPVGKATYAVFRATRIPPDHPALVGKTLEPMDPQPEILPPPEPPAEDED